MRKEPEHGTNEVNSFACNQIPCSGSRSVFRFRSGTAPVHAKIWV